MRIGKRGWWRAGIVVLIGAAAFMAYAPPATTQSSDPPQYDSSGNLLRPVGFETWVFVGSNLGLTYKGEPKPKPDAEQYHNVFMKPQAYQEFVRDQKFPDRTVFVIDLRTKADKDPNPNPMGELINGSYNDQRTGILVAVKDLNHPRPPGSKTPWAYYIFPMEGNKMPDSEKAQDAANCEECHRTVNAKTDNVWVQFYPILRDLMK
jgi:hypothetical protein